MGIYKGFLEDFFTLRSVLSLPILLGGSARRVRTAPLMAAFGNWLQAQRRKITGMGCRPS